LATAYSGVPPQAGKARDTMFTVYIIKSDRNDRYYIGVTADLRRRLRYHNGGANRSTRKQGPWQVVYSEEFSSKENAWRWERQIKKYKGGAAFKRLINQGGVA